LVQSAQEDQDVYRAVDRGSHRAKLKDSITISVADCAIDAVIAGYDQMSGYATNQASEFESVNTSATERDDLCV
jgi:hypothetical protein